MASFLKAINDWRASEKDGAVLESLLAAKDVARVSAFLDKFPRISSKKWAEVWENSLTKRSADEDTRADQIFERLKTHRPLKDCVKEKTLEWAVHSVNFYKLHALVTEWSWSKEELSEALNDAMRVGTRETYGTYRYVTAEQRIEFSKNALMLLKERGADLHAPLQRGNWNHKTKNRETVTVWSQFEEARYGLHESITALLLSWNEENQLRQVLRDVPKEKNVGPAL
jgi:hypothetical protein